MSIQTYFTGIGRAIMYWPSMDRVNQPCPECELRRDAEMSAEYDIDRLAAQDPELSLGHRYASDAEYAEHLNSQERS